MNQHEHFIPVLCMTSSKIMLTSLLPLLLFRIFHNFQYAIESRLESLRTYEIDFSFMIEPNELNIKKL